MRNDWILDVLTDLRTFAEQNGMAASASHLLETCEVVAAELERGETGAPVEQANVHEIKFGEFSGGYPAG